RLASATTYREAIDARGARTCLPVADEIPGSARVSRVGDCVLAIADFCRKRLFRRDGNPTHETRALPRSDFVGRLAAACAPQSRLKTAQPFRAHSRRLDVAHANRFHI